MRLHPENAVLAEVARAVLRGGGDEGGAGDDVDGAGVVKEESAALPAAQGDFFKLQMKIIVLDTS